MCSILVLVFMHECRAVLCLSAVRGAGQKNWTVGVKCFKAWYGLPRMSAPLVCLLKVLVYFLYKLKGQYVVLEKKLKIRIFIFTIPMRSCYKLRNIIFSMSE